MRSLSYHPLAELSAEDSTSAVDGLWKASLLLHPKRPGWSGLMQMVQKGEHQGQCSVTYLPMIDINPSDFSCVFSTLSYVSSPKALLEVIRCSCKTGCSTKRCSCRRADLDCSPACGECRGACSNISPASQENPSNDHTEK